MITRIKEYCIQALGKIPNISAGGYLLGLTACNFVLESTDWTHATSPEELHVVHQILHGEYEVALSGLKFFIRESGITETNLELRDYLIQQVTLVITAESTYIRCVQVGAQLLTRLIFKQRSNGDNEGVLWNLLTRVAASKSANFLQASFPLVGAALAAWSCNMSSNSKLNVSIKTFLEQSARLADPVQALIVRSAVVKALDHAFHFNPIIFSDFQASLYPLFMILLQDDDQDQREEAAACICRYLRVKVHLNLPRAYANY